MKKAIIILTTIFFLNLLLVNALDIIKSGLIAEPIDGEIINNNITINGNTRIINHQNPLTVKEGSVEIPEYSSGAVRGITSERYGVYGFSASNTGVYGKGQQFGLSGTSDFGTGVYGMGYNFGLYGYSNNVGVYGWGGRDQGYGGKFYGYRGVYAASIRSYGFETPNSLYVGQDATILGKIKGQVISVFNQGNITGYNFCNKFDNIPELWNWECIKCIKSSGEKISCYAYEQNTNCICLST